MNSTEGEVWPYYTAKNATDLLQVVNFTGLSIDLSGKYVTTNTVFN